MEDTSKFIDIASAREEANVVWTVDRQRQTPPRDSSSQTFKGYLDGSTLKRGPFLVIYPVWKGVLGITSCENRGYTQFWFSFISSSLFCRCLWVCDERDEYVEICSSMQRGQFQDSQKETKHFSWDRWFPAISPEPQRRERALCFSQSRWVLTCKLLWSAWPEFQLSLVYGGAGYLVAPTSSHGSVCFCVWR